MPQIGFCINCCRNNTPLAWRLASRPDAGICLDCFIPKINPLEYDTANVIVAKELYDDDNEEEHEENREEINSLRSELKPRHFRLSYKRPLERQSTIFKFLPKEVTSKALKSDKFISYEEELRAKSTMRLIEEFISCGLDVTEQFAREVVRRGDSLKYLRAILENEEYWHSKGPGDGWIPFHTLHIIAMQGTGEGLELMLEVLRNDADKIGGDFLTKNVPTLLAAFGEGSIKKLEKFIQDEELDKSARNSAAIALTILGHQYPDLASEVLSILLQLVCTTTDATLAALQVDDVLSFRNPICLPVIKNAFAFGQIDTRIIEWEDVLKILNKPEGNYDYIHFIHDPAAHFSEETRARLRRVNYTTQVSRPDPESHKKMPLRAPITNKNPKIGRNDPCPCGSGKKYKHCCLINKRARIASPK